MSLAGFKKQLNKANQYVSEKIGGAKGTELDDDFVEMERKIDVMGNLVNELMARTHEHLQPNPASRAKLSAVKSISKFRGQANVLLYPQPEGVLGECMAKFGAEMGDDSLFGSALAEAGESYKQLADIKYGLEDCVKQNFIEPLHHIQTKDLKEVNHHRKKLSGRRLDYDCKRRKHVKGAPGEPGEPGAASSTGVTEEDIASAEEKFADSKELAETSMFNLLENDVEQISALASFIEAEVTFHRQSAEVLAALHETLQTRIEEAANRPRREHVPRRVTSFSTFDKTPSPSFNHDKQGNNFDTADNSGYSLSPAPPSYNQTVAGSRGDLGDLHDPSKGKNKSNPFSPSFSGMQGPPPYTQGLTAGGVTQQQATNLKTAHGNRGSSSSSSVSSATSPTAAPRRSVTAADPFGGFDPFANPTYNNNLTASSSSSGMMGGHSTFTSDMGEYASVDWSKKRASQQQQQQSNGGGGRQPCAEALYDFDPENEGELGFKEGDMITLTQRIDENWFEGSVNGNSGFFPVNYVKVVVDVQ